MINVRMKIPLWMIWESSHKERQSKQIHNNKLIERVKMPVFYGLNQAESIAENHVEFDFSMLLN